MIYLLIWLIAGVLSLLIDTLYFKPSWIECVEISSFPRENTIGVAMLGALVLLWPFIIFMWVFAWIIRRSSK